MLKRGEGFKTFTICFSSSKKKQNKYLISKKQEYQLEIEFYRKLENMTMPNFNKSIIKRTPNKC